MHFLTQQYGLINLHLCPTTVIVNEFSVNSFNTIANLSLYKVLAIQPYMYTCRLEELVARL